MLLFALAAVIFVVEPASGATLWTNASRTTTVSTSATASLTSGTVTARSGATTVNTCASSTLNLSIQQNNASGVVGSVTGGSFNNCFSAVAAGGFPWTVTIRGGGATAGAATVFAQTTWEGVRTTLWGSTPASGTLAGGSPPANGVYARQSFVTESSICLVLGNAGTLAGTSLDDGKIDATYCLEGEAATTWSLGDRRDTSLTGSALSAGPANATVPLGSTIANGGSGPATWSFSGGIGTTLQCTTTTSDITVGASGGATVNGVFDRLEFSGCTDDFSAMNIQSCAFGAASVRFKGLGATGGTAVLGDTPLRCSIPPVACYYTPVSVIGVYSNVPSSLAFSGATFTYVTPAGTTDALTSFFCGTHATFGATLTDLTLGGPGTTAATLRTL